MSDAFYKNSIHNFLRQSDDEIFGIIAAGDRYDTVAAQKDAWMEQIRKSNAYVRTWRIALVVN